MSQADEVCRYYDALKMKRTNLDNTVQEIIDNIDSHHPDVLGERAIGERKNSRQFDGSALNASQVFADFYQSSVFNHSTKWWIAAHRAPQINAKPENAGWLMRYRDFGLQNMRRFYSAAGQAIGAWTLFGNGPLLVEEVPNRKHYQDRLRFTSPPFGQYVMAEGDDRRIDQFIWCHRMPAHQIVTRFGKASDEVMRCANSSNLAEQNKEFEVLHSILPRDFQEYSKSAIKTAKDYDFASCWVEKGKKQLLKESGYRKFPVAVARMHMMGDEVWARGLGEIALADAKTLNLMDELSLLKGARELDPAVLVKRNSIINGILDMRAKGKTVVTDINNSVRPILENGNWPVFEHMQARKTDAIMRVFHVKDIMDLLAHEKTQWTAFEVNARLNLLQQILGPVFGYNDVDFFSVIIDVTMDLLSHMTDENGNNLVIANCGDIPEDLALSIGQVDAMQIIFDGPLARAQRMAELQNIQQSVADLAGIDPFYPEGKMMVDWQKLVASVFEIRGTSQLLLDEDQFEVNVEAMRKKQADMEAAQMIAGAAQSLGQAAPGIKVLQEQGMEQ